MQVIKMFIDTRSVFASLLLYLDPGSGSLIIQLLLAVFLGIGVAVRLYWTKIKTLFYKESQAIPVPEDKKTED